MYAGMLTLEALHSTCNACASEHPSTLTERCKSSFFAVPNSASQGNCGCVSSTALGLINQLAWAASGHTVSLAFTSASNLSKASSGGLPWLSKE